MEISKEELKAKIIDNTIIAALKENNIFESIMTVEQVREKLMNNVQDIVYDDFILGISRAPAGWPKKSRALAGWHNKSRKMILPEELKDMVEFPSMQDRGNIIHELLHALSTTENFVGIEHIDSLKGKGLNEGITEYLSQKLCPLEEHDVEFNKVEFSIAGSYEFQQQMIKKIAILYGEDKIIDAYFNNHDIDMPKYIYLREGFDQITKWIENRVFRYPIEEIESEFIQSQKIFFDNCVLNELKNIDTLEQAEDFKIKLDKLKLLKECENIDYVKADLGCVLKYITILNNQDVIGNDEKIQKLRIMLYGMIPADKNEIITKIENDDLKLGIFENNKNDDFIIESLESENKKIEALNEIKDEYYKTKIISSLTDEEKKIELLGEIEDERNKAAIISSLTDDDKKIEFLTEVDFVNSGEKERNKAKIIASLEDDDKKLEFLDEIEVKGLRSWIIASLTDDDKKIEALNEIKDEYSKTKIIASLTDEDKKIELLGEIEDERNKATIISSLTDEDKKIELLGEIEEEWSKVAIISSLTDEDKKIELLGEIEEEWSKVAIISSLTDDNKKLELLKDIELEEHRVEIIKSLQDDNKKINLLGTIIDSYNVLRILDCLGYNFELETLEKSSGMQRLILVEQSKMLGKVENKEHDNSVEKLDVIKKYLAISLQDEMQGDIEMLKFMIINMGIVEARYCDSLNHKQKLFLLEKIESDFDKTEIIRNLQYDDEKIELLEYLKGDTLKAKIIASLIDEDEKLELLETIEDECNKAIVIASLAEDDEKLQELDKIEREAYKAEIIASLEDDDKKLQELDKIERESYKIDIIRSLKDDDEKVKFVKEQKFDSYKASIVLSLTDDNKKMGLLEAIGSDYYKALIVESLNDDKKRELSIDIEKNNETIDEELKKNISSSEDIQKVILLRNDKNKIEFLNKYFDKLDKKRANVIASFKSDDEKIKQLLEIEEYERSYCDKNVSEDEKKQYESYKLEIIKSIKNNDSKLKLLSEIKDPNFKLMVLFFIENNTSISKIRDCIEGKDEKEKLISSAKEKQQTLLDLKIENEQLKEEALKNKGIIQR